MTVIYLPYIGSKRGGSVHILYIVAALVFLPVIVSCILLLFICALFVNTGKEYEQDSAFYRFLLNASTLFALKFLRIKVHTEGLEKVPVGEKLLFVSNHRSKYDPIITWYIFRKWRIAYISKIENFDVPIFGRIIRKCCFMAIDRENPKKAISTINKAASLLKRDEVSIGVYPEGARSKTKELLPFHNGVLRIAQKAKVPIVVMSLDGTEEIFRNIKGFKASHIRLVVEEVIPVDEACGVVTDVVGKRIEEDLKRTLYEKSHI